MFIETITDAYTSATAGGGTIWNEEDEQKISFTLVFYIPRKYPYELPELSFENPRGLSHRQITEMTHDLQPKLNALLGSEMIYEIIEIIKVNLNLKIFTHVIILFI